MRHTRAHPEPAKASQRIPRQARAHPEDNTETYQSITIAHHETYQRIPAGYKQDTSRIPEPARGYQQDSQSIPRQGMRHTRAYQTSL